MTAAASRSSAQSAPHSAPFAGHAHGIRGDLAARPGRARAHAPTSRLHRRIQDFCASQRIDDAVRQIGRAHIGNRRRVDRIARRPAQKIAQEHEARFARSGAERREPVRAELRRVTGLAGVARPGVVDADAGRGAKAGARTPLPPRRGTGPAWRSCSRHHLALRDRQARSGQHGHDPLTGHLTLKMQRQNQTMQMRAAAAHNARRQFSRDVRRPASPTSRR